MRVKFLQKVLDILRGKRCKKHNLKYFEKLQNDFNLKLKNLSKKYKNGQKIKVAFLFMYSTSIQNLCIFDEMLKSDIFDPYFIVNPDVYRSKDNFDYNYKRTKQELIKKYGKERVLDGYDYENEKFIDYTHLFDMATSNNPYDIMAHKYFKVSYWGAKKIPMFYISYFYMGRCYVTINNFKIEESNYLWKFFAENNGVLDIAKEYQILKGKNIIVTGYPKMDKLNDIKISKNTDDKKLVIIAPHHTIDDSDTSVGSFLEYYDIIKELPRKYSRIIFVFRPHPMLIENLNTKYWGKEKTKNYIKELTSNENVIYSTEGDYLELFAKSDALIHDCGSFSAEYFYTGKPCAYMFKKNLKPDLIWTDFGRKCINLHYPIKKSQDLYTFIDNVVLKGEDPLQKKREDFASKEIKINYPHSTDKIMEELSNAIKGIIK